MPAADNPPPAPSSALDVTGLTKTFTGGRALDGVDLQIAAGEVHALLGGNGSGKSTLIKVLSGYHLPDDGAVVRVGGQQLDFGSSASSYRLGARFVHQDLGLVEDSSITDNLAFGPGFPTRFGTINEREASKRATNALGAMGLDVDPKSKVARLSPAQKTGVAAARAPLSDEHSPARLLVLDEPTARLPDEEVEQLLAIVRTVAASGIGILYVTHRLDEVFEIADRATVLRDGRRVATEPIAGLTRQALLHQLFGETLEKAHRRAEPISADVAPVLRVTNLSSEVLRGVSLEVRPGEVVGVAGVTGSGREALCATIFGARTHDAGAVQVEGKTLPADEPDAAIARGVAYVPAERKLSGCFVDLPATENITISNLKDVWSFPFLRRAKEAEMVHGWFDRLGVRPKGNINALMSSFSGGNQQKIIYGKWFQRQPVLFLLDEPTQGVDVAAKAELHRALFQAAEQGSAVLVSSTDVDELTTISDRVVVLLGGRVVANLTGSDINVHAMTRAALGIDTPEKEWPDMDILRRGLGFERFSGLYLWAVLILIFTLWQSEYFPTMDTAHSLATERSIAAILALAIIIPLACGAFDLSVGAVANLATINAALLINDGVSWPIAAVVSVVVSAIIGAVNGFVVIKLHVSSFITTLGSSAVIAAIQILRTDNLQPLAPSIESWSNFTQRTVFGFQIVFFYMLVMALILWWVLEHTPVGRYLYAIGSSPEAARLSGAPVSRYTFLSLVASATIAGVAGVFFSSISGPSLTYGGGLLLPAFAAAFLGSTQIVPGRFNVWGTVLAIFVLATGVKGLQLAYPAAQWLDPMFSGAALILAVAVAVGRQRSGEERTRKRLAREDASRTPPDHELEPQLGDADRPNPPLGTGSN